MPGGCGCFQSSLQQWQSLAYPSGQGIGCAQFHMAMTKGAREVHSFGEGQRPFEHVYGLGQRPLAQEEMANVRYMPR